ncbi:MAG: acyl carrier protein [Bacteroidaceae bacterium]|nr:acyl carrier protein [Bacteroidaceae bacterium]
MEIQEFIEKFAEAIEVENVEALTAETEFHGLEEWSSLSVMLIIAFFDSEFDKQIGDREIRQAVTIEDLYKLATA